MLHRAERVESAPASSSFIRKFLESVLRKTWTERRRAFCSGTLARSLGGWQLINKGWIHSLFSLSHTPRSSSKQLVVTAAFELQKSWNLISPESFIKSARWRPANKHKEFNCQSASCVCERAPDNHFWGAPPWPAEKSIFHQNATAEKTHTNDIKGAAVLVFNPLQRGENLSERMKSKERRCRNSRLISFLKRKARDQNVMHLNSNPPVSIISKPVRGGFEIGLFLEAWFCISVFLPNILSLRRDVLYSLKF